MKPSFGSQKGRLSRTCSRACAAVIPYRCIRNAQTTVALRLLPMALRLESASALCVPQTTREGDIETP